MSSSPHAEDAFVAAVANERQYDVYAMRMAGLSPEADQVLFRPLRVARCAGRFPRLTRYALQTVGMLWWLLFPLALCAGALRLCWLKLFTRHSHVELQRVALACTPRLASSLGRVPAAERPRQVITIPWCKLPPLPAEYQQVSLISLMQWNDIWPAMVSSWSVARRSSRTFPGRMDRLQTFCALSFMISWRVLARSLAAAQQVWVANHFDRWAVLADRLPVEAERVLVQHGCLHAGHAMPTRLDRFSQLYYFDDASQARFLTDVFAQHNVPRCHRTSAALELSEVELPPGACGVLIVGHPAQVALERALTERMLAYNSSIHVLIKPHPSFATTGYREFPHERVKRIEEPRFFPRVDLVVCHASTLGLEYEASGIPVIWIAERSLDQAWTMIAAWLQEHQKLDELPKVSNARGRFALSESTRPSLERRAACLFVRKDSPCQSKHSL